MNDTVLLCLMATIISSVEEVSYTHAVKKAISILHEVQASLE